MARLDLQGDPLPPFALARLGTVRWRHGGTTIDSLALSRDGGVVFAAGGGVTAIDVATGAIRWRAHDPAASQIALLPAPDGDRLAAVGLRGALSLYGAADGARLSTVELPSTLLTSLAVSRDGRTIFAGGFKPYGALLGRDGSVRAALPVEGGSYLNSGVFSPDDATLVTTDVDAGVALWSVADARRVRTLGRANLQPNHTAFTPDGKRLVVAACDGGVTVFDLASGEEITRWKAHRASAHRVAVTPDGLRVVSASEDGERSLWRLADGARLATRAGGRGIPSLALCPDGATVAYSVGPRVALVDLATFEERAPPTGHTAAVQAFAVARDDAAVVTVAGPGEARWWSLADGRALAQVPLDAFVTALRPLPEGDRYAVMQPGARGTTVIDVAARALAQRPETFADAHQKWWGRAVEATMLQGGLTLTNARGELHTRKAIPHQLAFTPDDRYAVYVERSTLTLWDLDAHAAVATVKVAPAAGLALSPRGDEVAVWRSAGVQRFGVPDGALRATWKASGDPVTAVTYAPDGGRMAVVTFGGVRLLDVASGAEVARLEGHGALLTSASFDRDGGRLVTASWDTTGLVWSVAEAVAGHAPPAAKRKRSPTR
jgi:WD40 repeat protein